MRYKQVLPRSYFGKKLLEQPGAALPSAAPASSISSEAGGHGRPAPSPAAPVSISGYYRKAEPSAQAVPALPTAPSPGTRSRRGISRGSSVALVEPAFRQRGHKADGIPVQHRLLPAAGGGCGVTRAVLTHVIGSQPPSSATCTTAGIRR